MAEQSTHHVNRWMSLWFSRFVPLALMALLTASIPAPAVYIPGISLQPPLAPLTPQPSDCSNSAEISRYTGTALRVGMHIGTEFDPETVHAIRLKIDAANCHNSEVLGGFMPMTALVTEELLENHPNTLKEWTQYMVNERFLPNFRIVTNMVDGKWQMPDVQTSYKMGKQFAQLAVQIENLPPKLKIMITLFNEPNLIPKENDLQPEEVGQRLVAFREGLGKPENLLYLYPALSMNVSARMRAEEFLARSLQGGGAGMGDFDGFELHVQQPTSREALSDVLDQISMFKQWGGYFTHPVVVVKEYAPELPSDNQGCNDPRWPAYAQPLLLQAAQIGPEFGINYYTAVCFDRDDRLYFPIFDYQTGDVMQLNVAQ